MVKAKVTAWVCNFGILVQNAQAWCGWLGRMGHLKASLSGVLGPLTTKGCVQWQPIDAWPVKLARRALHKRHT